MIRDFFAQFCINYSPTERLIIGPRLNTYVFGELTVLVEGYVSNAYDFITGNKNDLNGLDDNRVALCFANAYKRFGLKLSQYVNGQYVMAIYDSKKKILLISHDTLGLVPLYYYTDGSTLAFSTVLKNLVSGNVGKAIDEDYIAEYLCFGDYYGSRTPYANIKCLQPGTALVVSMAGHSIIKCWNLQDVKPLIYSNPDDYVEHMRTLLMQSIKSALPANTNVMCELSGGLDSSSVASITSILNSPIRVNSMSFIYEKSRLADESQYVKAVVERHQLVSNTIDVDKFPPFQSLPKLHCGQPYHGMIYHDLYTEYDRVLVEKSIGMVLTGMGGDAVLFGDGPEPFYFADFFLSGKFLKGFRQIYSWKVECTEKRALRFWIKHLIVNPSINYIRQRVIQDNRPPLVTWLHGKYDKGQRITGTFRNSYLPSCHNLGDTWFLEKVLRSANVISNSEHKFQMNADFRHPLMDISLVKFMLSIPWEIKLSSKIDRPLQRKAMSKELPSLIKTRITKGGPDQNLYTALENNSEWIQLLYKGQMLGDRGYIDLNKWKTVIDQTRLGNTKSIKLFKATATLETWFQQFNS